MSGRVIVEAVDQHYEAFYEDSPELRGSAMTEDGARHKLEELRLSQAVSTNGNADQTVNAEVQLNQVLTHQFDRPITLNNTVYLFSAWRYSEPAKQAYGADREQAIKNLHEGKFFDGSPGTPE